MENKRGFALALMLGLAMTAGCSSQDEADDAATTQGEAETTAQGTAPEAERTDIPQMLSAEELAALAHKEMGTGNSWDPATQITVSGVVVNTILDEPPKTYIAFGRSPTDVDIFAAMEQPFGRDMQYAKPEFTGTDGSSTVACTGTVTRVDADSPPLVDECYPVFNQQ